MPKLTLTTLEPFGKRLRQSLVPREGAARRPKITVHMGSCGIAAGAQQVLTALSDAVEKRGLEEVVVATTGCAGLCSREPMATVTLPGQPPVKYVALDAKKILEILDQHVLQGRIVSDHAFAIGSERTYLAPDPPSNGHPVQCLVCDGTGCVTGAAYAIKEAILREVDRQGLTHKVQVLSMGCSANCAVGPVLQVRPEGVFYQKLTEKDIPLLVEEHLLNGRPVEALRYTPPEGDASIPKMSEIPFFSKQRLIALKTRGLIDPERLEEYIAWDGYSALAKVLAQGDPGAVIKEITASGLRGRGGGGFPAGVKWETCRHASLERGEEAYVVCNADEGDPGAFMDRSLLESDPHAVVEGMCIGAYAVGARQGYVYIRREYPIALQRLRTALEQARDHGLLGENVLGTDFSFDIEPHQGAGAFVCGESTALMASLEGRVGEPRAKYIHTVEYGLYNHPTVLNNVETWANVPGIINRGAKWFASMGTGDVSENPWGGSSGTKIFSLVGNVTNTGLVEVPMGTTLREIIFDIGGGIPNGKAFKAVQTGGPSGGCLPESLLDMPVDFDQLVKVGSMMGSGGMIVMDENTCMVDFARYFIDFLKGESCGKCVPCREGIRNLLDVLEGLCEGRGKEGDIELLEEVSGWMESASLCALGTSAPHPVLSTTKYFRDEYIAHFRDHKCPAGVCKALIQYGIDQDKCNGCMRCARDCPQEAISGEKKQPHAIDAANCIKCGVCRDVCQFEAVYVV